MIGSRFDTDLLTSMVDSPDVAPLIEAELVDQVRFTPRAEYAFRHPLIRTVAYESQLKSDRAQLHRRLAAAIEHRDPASADENAALIAEHLEAAGDLHAAFGWHMRAGTWSTNRDIAAAQTSWRRARQVADRLPDDDPDRTAMRIAPRTLLCGSAWRVGGSGADTGFDELRDLCTAAGDQRSLAIGMAGQVIAQCTNAHRREASRLATEHTALLESIGDPTLTVGAVVRGACRQVRDRRDGRSLAVGAARHRPGRRRPHHRQPDLRITAGVRDHIPWRRPMVPGHSRLEGRLRPGRRDGACGRPRVPCRA